MNPHLFGALSNQQISFRLILMDKKTIVPDFVFAIVWPGIFFIRGT